LPGAKPGPLPRTPALVATAGFWAWWARATASSAALRNGPVLSIKVVYPTPAPSDQGSIPLVGDQFCPSNCPTIETHLVSPERRAGRGLPPELGERYACGPSRQGRPLSQGGDTGSNPVGAAPAQGCFWQTPHPSFVRLVSVGAEGCHQSLVLRGRRRLPGPGPAWRVGSEGLQLDCHGAPMLQLGRGSAERR
jgi:hypothetical protein